MDLRRWKDGRAEEPRRLLGMGRERKGRCWVRLGCRIWVAVVVLLSLFIFSSISLLFPSTLSTSSRESSVSSALPPFRPNAASLTLLLSALLLSFLRRYLHRHCYPHQSLSFSLDPELKQEAGRNASPGFQLVVSVLRSACNQEGWSSNPFTFSLFAILSCVFRDV